MPAEFLLPRTQGKPLTVRLERDAVVGRGSAAGLRISSRRVSRAHCRVHIDGECVRVRDLGSRNGTFVNGAGVGEEDAEVPVGAVLSVGGVALKLVRVGDTRYRPDGAALVEEVAPHAPVGDVQDSPSSTVVGQDDPEDLSDENVAVVSEAPRTVLPPAADDDFDPEEGTALAEDDDADDGDADGDEAAALDFLNDGAEAAAERDPAALAVLPGGDARDQSSFAGFGDPDDADVDSELLGFLNGPR